MKESPASNEKRPFSQKTWTLTRHRPMTQNARLGKCAENLVCFHLKSLGWTIRERNLASRYGEIDIIAQKYDEDLKGYPTIAFVEVKSRSTNHGLLPVLSVTASKRKHMTYMRKLWIGRHSLEKAVYRFDIASVIIPKNRLPKIIYYPNAFVAKEDFGW